MKEKAKNNITTLKKVIAIICGIIIIITGIYLCYSHNHKYNGDYQTAGYHGINSLTKSINQKKPYMLINSYSEYTELIKKAHDYGWTNIENKYNSSFFENNSLVFVEILNFGAVSMNTELISLKEHNNSVNVEIYVNSRGCTADVSGDLYLIPVSKKVTNVNIKYVDDDIYQKENVVGAIIIFMSVVALFITFRKKKENENTKKSILKIFGIIIVSIVIVIVGIFVLMVHNNSKHSLDKPIIYLYPTEDTKVTVKLQYSDNITVSYPKYIAGWNVLAKHDGTLVDLSTNKNLYSLYYESTSVEEFKVEEDGFIVKREDSAIFLEEKLAILGLSERESEEFIIYWLPKLENNNYNYIRFATIDEIDKNMPLDINPNPDTIIRILMTYKGLNKPIAVKEQQLLTPERTGFVAVEWGGTEIK